MWMVMDIVHGQLPMDWSYMSSNNSEYELVNIPEYSSQYRSLQSEVKGSFNLKTKKIERVQNSFLYGQFLLKKEEYATRGNVNIVKLYHDTAETKIPLIVSGNLDWRRAQRVKYGKSVSFSPSPAYANCQSSRSNGTNRAMIIADVLVGEAEHVYGSKPLPDAGYDTSIGNNRNVYVKYYDNEFYPKYVVYYSNW